MDFDGTLFETDYINDLPVIADPRREVIDKLLEFQKTRNCEIILWTCREGERLKEAVKECQKYGLEFCAVNDNSPSEKRYLEKVKSQSREIFAQKKIYADLYVDDKAPGSIEFFLKIDVEKTCKSFENR